ncbi:MAG: nitrogenase component 1 [Bacillota bacterium]|nr:nitrogenase component 1 [Bacillota bacterium]
MAYIERPRFSCMLGGVLATLSALPRTIPIIHGAQGCGGNLSAAYSLGGYLGAGYCGNSGVPSSNIGESDIIFGGGEKLIREINSTFEVMDGDLYVVTTTCMTDIIGDDIKGILNEVGQKDKPILFIDTGGFKGNSYYGYTKLIQELFAQYIPQKNTKQNNLVNIFGLVPGYDPYFRGDLEELKRILELVGVEANTFFTHDQTQQNILRAGEASLNIVLSRVYGPEAAIAVKDTHGIDYLITDLPIGNLATVGFVWQVAEKLGLDREKVSKALYQETDSYFKYIDRATDLIADTDFQNYAVVIANATEALPYAKYLDNEIGWITGYIFITDELTEEQKNAIRQVFDDIEFSIRPELVFETDTYRIQQYIEQNNPQFKSDAYYETFSPAFVLGSTIDRKLAEVLNGGLLSISFPVINRIILAKGYAGFKGGLNLLEDLITGQISGR